MKKLTRGRRDRCNPGAPTATVEVSVTLLDSVTAGSPAKTPERRCCPAATPSYSRVKETAKSDPAADADRIPVPFRGDAPNDLTEGEAFVVQALQLARKIDTSYAAWGRHVAWAILEDEVGDVEAGATFEGRIRDRVHAEAEARFLYPAAVAAARWIRYYTTRERIWREIGAPAAIDAAKEAEKDGSDPGAFNRVFAHFRELAVAKTLAEIGGMPPRPVQEQQEQPALAPAPTAEKAERLVSSLRHRLGEMLAELEAAYQEEDDDLADEITGILMRTFERTGRNFGLDPLAGPLAHGRAQITASLTFVNCLFGEENLPYSEHDVVRTDGPFEMFAALQPIATAPMVKGDAARRLMCLFGEAVQHRYHNRYHSGSRESENKEGANASAD